MVVASGDRPYLYEGPWPFSASGIGKIGYSGILFEQIMFVLQAEADLYQEKYWYGSEWLGEPALFSKLINSQSGPKYTATIVSGFPFITGFEPDAYGRNLDGTFDGWRGNCNFNNYINDMRWTLFFYVLDMLETDTNYDYFYVGGDVPDLATRYDYFATYLSNNPSGAIGRFRHTLLGKNMYAGITDALQSTPALSGELGEDGDLYDIDLREVQYQPYIRFGPKHRMLTSVTNSGYASGIGLILMPIFPQILNTSGLLPYITSRDLQQMKQNRYMDPGVFAGYNYILASGYDALASGRMLIAGDMLDIDNTKLFLLWNGFKLIDTTSGICKQIGPRCISYAYDGGNFITWSGLNRGFGLFEIPSGQVLPCGIYGVQLYNESSTINNIYSPQSGKYIGFYPHRYEAERIQHSGWETNALHITNNVFYMWNKSGVAYLSPYNGDGLLFRFADNSTATSGNGSWFGWNPTNASNFIKDDYIVTFVKDIAYNVSETGSLFVRYNARSLDFVDTKEVILPGSTGSHITYIYGHSAASGETISEGYFTSSFLMDTTYIPIQQFATFEATADDCNANIMINNHIYSTHLFYDVGFPPPVDSHYYCAHLVYDTVSGYYREHTYEWRQIAYAPDMVSIPLIPASGFFDPYIYTWIDPKYTSLDRGDGSVIVLFKAQYKASLTFFYGWGYIKESSSGTLDIFNYRSISNYYGNSLAGDATSGLQTTKWIHTIV